MTAISIQTRSLNVVLKPGSEAYRHSPRPTDAHSHGGAASPHLAPGFSPRPSWNLKNFGGADHSRDHVCQPLSRRRRGVVELGHPQHRRGPVGGDGRCRTQHRDRAVLQRRHRRRDDARLGHRSRRSASHRVQGHALRRSRRTCTPRACSARADPARSVINMMLPKGTVLSDDFSPGFHPPAGEEETHDHRRKRGVLHVGDDDAASSKNGLGGYHGSIHVGHGTPRRTTPSVCTRRERTASTRSESRGRTSSRPSTTSSTKPARTWTWRTLTRPATSTARLVFADRQGEIGDLPINACGR